jgi:hypothetical protein
MIKYASTWDNGNSTLNADTILTTTSCRSGIVSEPAKFPFYRNELGYGPLMVDENAGICLSSVPAIKCNGGSAQWNHYIDHHRLTPNVRITQPSNLYLIFHVFEYPTVDTLRSLAVEVSATWLDDLEERKKREEKPREKLKRGRRRRRGGRERERRRERRKRRRNTKRQRMMKRKNTSVKRWQDSR